MPSSLVCLVKIEASNEERYALKWSTIQSHILNPRPTGRLFNHLTFFLDICHTIEATNAQLAVPFGPSILHPTCT